MKKLTKDIRILLGLAGILVVMIALVSFSVPLYRIFCSATGFGGTTQRVADAPQNTTSKAADRIFTVSFDGNVDGGLPWDFAPEVKNIRVKLGETVTVTYRAHNRGTTTTTGTATHNVQPDKAGLWFDKIQCFCFTKQTLKPGETKELAVQFYIDPAIIDDHQNDDVQNITLSYTFFPAKDTKS